MTVQSLYVRVKWEGTSLEKVVIVQIVYRSTHTVQPWYINGYEYDRLMSEIDKVSPRNGKQLVCIDYEGDEVSECMNVVGRVPVAVFL